MSYKKIGVLVLVALALTLSACTRSASQAPLLAATPTSEFPFPLETPDSAMTTIQQIATQTALALQAGTPVEATPTPEGVEPTPDLFGSGAAGGTPTSPVATVAVTPTPLTRPSSYTLQKGEHVYCIARRYNLNPNELLSLNGLSQNQQVFPGLTLNIPQTGNPFPADRALLSHPTSYTVASGDTIYSVACKFGDVDPLAIVSVNNLASPYTLTAGQSISIP